jgi:hypothetical protein
MLLPWLKTKKQILQHAAELVIFKNILFRLLLLRTMGALDLPARRQGMRYALRLQCSALFNLTLKEAKTASMHGLRQNRTQARASESMSTNDGNRFHTGSALIRDKHTASADSSQQSLSPSERLLETVA